MALVRSRKPYEKFRDTPPPSPPPDFHNPDDVLDWLGRGPSVRPDSDPYLCGICHVLRVYDQSTDNLVCPDCGRCVYAFGLRDVSGHTDRSVYLADRPNTPYKSLFHIHERMAVLENRASVLPLSHLETIQAAARLIHEDGVDRDAVQRILTAADRLATSVPSSDSAPSARRRRRFSFRKRYLEQWPIIKMRLTGRRPPVMDCRVGLKIDQLFGGVCAAWRKVRPSDRLNMPNFSFMLLKLFEFIRYEHMDEWLHQLKTTSHRRRNAVWWEQICVYNGWPFIPMSPLTFAQRRARFDATQLEEPFGSLFQRPLVAPTRLHC